LRLKGEVNTLTLLNKFIPTSDISGTHHQKSLPSSLNTTRLNLTPFFAANQNALDYVTASILLLVQMIVIRI
jgi:hypothetical protein